MKEIIALQEYTDKYISLYEGEIRNVSEGIADKLIEQGVVAEHSDSSSSGNSSEGAMVLNVIFDDEVIHGTYGDSVKVTLDKTWNEINTAMRSGIPCIVNYNNPNYDNVALACLVSSIDYYPQGGLEDPPYVVNTAGIFSSWYAKTINDYPESTFNISSEDEDENQ